jgi:membrane protease YdiL (CAAX protease family)
LEDFEQYTSGDAIPRTEIYDNLGLSFNRSFWTIFIAILGLQIIQIVMWFLLDVDIEDPGEFYYLFTDILGMSWTSLLLLIVIFHIKQAHISVNKIFNFDFKILAVWSPGIIKYFLLCGAIVGVFAFLLPNSELDLEKRTDLAIGVSFFMIVIFAPIVEEMIFRGYLYTAMREKFKQQKERLVVNAMLFAAAHVFMLAFFLGASVPYYIFFLGYFLAKLYDESHSVLPGIALHSLNNLLVFIIEMAIISSNTESIYI